MGFHQCPRGDRACCSFPHRVRHCSPLGEIGEMHGAENLIPSVWPVFLSPKSASQWSILRALSDLFWKHSAGFMEKQSAKECRFPVSKALRGFTLSCHPHTSNSLIVLAEPFSLVFSKLTPDKWVFVSSPSCRDFILRFGANLLLCNLSSLMH